MPPKTLSPIDLAIALAGLIFSPELARIVGPYAVIVVAAVTGSAWALSRADKTSTWEALWFLTRMILTATLLTVSLAMLLRKLSPAWVGLESDEWLLAPIALLVGAVGNDWRHIGRWVVGRIGRMVDRRYLPQEPDK